MSTLVIHAEEIEIAVPGTERSSGDEAKLMVYGHIDDDSDNNAIIQFSFGIEGNGPYVKFEISGYDDIDALRRYCEMTLEHFRSGHLC